MLFGFYSKRDVELIRAQERMEGAKNAAETHKYQRDQLEADRALLENDRKRLLEGWADLKRAQVALEEKKASLILEGMKEVFSGHRVEDHKFRFW